MPESDLDLLITAAQDAGLIALRFWQQPVEVETKPDGSPVSAADLAVDAALRKVLTAARPDYGWMSEESADDPARLTAPATFIVDPIDGTRAYLDHSRDWALSLAVIRGGVPVAGVVHLPARGTTYAAAAGQGATRDGVPLQVSPRAQVDGASMLAARPLYAARNWPRGVPGFDRHFRSSMAWRLALVAEGRFDAMMTLRPSWDWDIAAGILLAAEAGAAVTDRTGAALRLNGPDRRSDGVVAANAVLHAAIRAQLAA